MSLNVPFSPESAGTVRRALVSWLAHQGSEPAVIADARLVVTELVANSIRHASPLNNETLLVRWDRVGDDLALTVCDGGGAASPTLVTVDYDSERGRGMAIVDALSLRWWSERSRRIHMVHVLIPLV